VRVNVHGVLPPGTERIEGSIIDFSPISLTIRSATGNVFAVRLVAATRYYVNGRLVPARPDFRYSEHVAVITQAEPDGSLNALTVRLRTS
jgi:hypothetical protein